MKRNKHITLKCGALWRLTVFAFVMGMVSGAGLHHTIRLLLVAGGAA